MSNKCLPMSKKNIQRCINREIWPLCKQRNTLFVLKIVWERVLPLPGAWLFLFLCRHLELPCAANPPASSRCTRTEAPPDLETLRTERTGVALCLHPPSVPIHSTSRNLTLPALECCIKTRQSQQRTQRQLIADSQYVNGRIRWAAREVESLSSPGTTQNTAKWLFYVKMQGSFKQTGGVTCLVPCDMVMSFAIHCKFLGFHGTKCIQKALNGMVPD